MKSRHKTRRFKEIFLVPHAHLDLSWLGTPSECEQINNGIIKSAVELLEAEPDYRYTVEAVRPLEKFLAGNPGEREKVKRLFIGVLPETTAFRRFPDVNPASFTQRV